MCRKDLEELTQQHRMQERDQNSPLSVLQAVRSASYTDNMLKKRAHKLYNPIRSSTESASTFATKVRIWVPEHRNLKSE